MKSLTPPEKAAMCREVEAAIESGLSLNQACKACGVSPANFVRWRDALASAGGDAFEAFAPKKPSGRPAAVEFSESDIALARWHRLTKGSLNIAAHFFMRDPNASHDVVAAMRQIEERALEAGREIAWPMSVRRAFEVSADEMARFRGSKAAQSTEMVTRRGMLWIDENGALQSLLPGELWELDDYSTNQPFTYLDPQTGALNLGRQVLAGMDVFTAGWLGFDMIGRPRDAYRGEDIVRFIGRLFRAHGVPRFLRLERGSWESSFIHGIEIDGRKWGELDALCRIEHVWKSKGKGTLEGSFNPLQNWLAHAGRDVGRHAGEFEESAKAWRQAKNAASRPDPRKLGFWSQTECASAHEEAARIMNSRPRDRKAIGERVAPDDLRARHGWHTHSLPAAEAWRLLPCKQRRVINAGHVNVNPGGGWPELSFVINGIEGLCLENGHAVLIACDPADPAAGAFVCNADQTARNRWGWGWGDPICSAAPIAQLAPQINLSGRRHGTLDLRRNAAAAAATEFRAIRAAAPGSREISVFDGTGRSATAGDLDRPATTEARPAATTRPPGRDGLAPTRPARGGSDSAALLGTDRAALLARMEEEAMKQI